MSDPLPPIAEPDRRGGATHRPPALADARSMVLIEKEGLPTCHGHRTVLDDTSVNVERGEILGILDPNAASDSTTV